MEASNFFPIFLKFMFFGLPAIGVLVLIAKICLQPNSSIEEANLELSKFFKFSIKNRITSDDNEKKSN